VVPVVIARVGSPVVRGRDAPFTSLDLSWDGDVGRASTRSGTDGWWRAELAGPDGPAAVVPGRVLRVAGSGGAEVVLTIPPLDLSVDAWGRVRGHAPPSALVAVTVADHATRFTVEVRAGLDGLWSVEPDALAAPPPFDLANTVAALAAITLPNGHRLEARAARGDPTATPSPVPTSTATTPSPTSGPTEPSATPTATPTATASPTASPTRVPVRPVVFLPWTQTRRPRS
jgi:hypothetical protein